LKRLFNWLERWEYKWLYLLVVIVLTLHFAIIQIPDKPVFDEAHYITDARLVINGGQTERGEHPAIGKLSVIGGMLIFGDTPLGWRFFPVLMDCVSLILFYLICRQLALSKRTSLLATFILAFENFTFLYFGLAMLDVACLTFTLAAFWLYLRGNYPASGIMVALAALSKLGGALALVAIGLHWLIVRRDKIWKFISMVAIAPVFFVVFMPITDWYPFHKFMNPIERIKTMLSGSASLTFANVTGTYPQKPIEWIFRWDLTPYFFHPNFLGVVSFTVEYLIVPTLIYMLVRGLWAQGRRKVLNITVPKKITLSTVPGNDAGIFALCWFAGTYLMWIPGVWLTNRVTYPYYIFPTIGAFCIGLGMGLAQLIRFYETHPTGKMRWAALGFVVLFLLAHLAFFALVSPLSYYWGTPIYSGLQS
jgi:dolichyl-phosphate-mannose-protein mannosyltransferase